VPEPAGTRGGYDDLCGAATREPIGKGLRPRVASIADLARILAALGCEQDLRSRSRPPDPHHCAPPAKTSPQIARELNATGTPTAHGGAQWWPSTVRAVLRRSLA
jgi:hypothetical protein